MRTGSPFKGACGFGRQTSITWILSSRLDDLIRPSDRCQIIAVKSSRKFCGTSYLWRRRMALSFAYLPDLLKEDRSRLVALGHCCGGKAQWRSLGQWHQ